MLPRLLLFVIVAIAMLFIAKRKGFNPFLWIFAGSVIGLIILIFLPAASQDGISDEERRKRAQFANGIGGILTGIVALFTFLFFYLVFNPASI